MMKTTLLTVLITSLVYSSCVKGNEDRNDNKTKAIPKAESAVGKEIYAIDSFIDTFGNDSIDDNNFLIEHADAVSDYLFAMGYTGENLEESIDSMKNSAAFKIFYADVMERLPISDRQTLEKSLSRVSQKFKEGFPKVPDYCYYEVISPYAQTIMTSDSMMFIAVNHYLGEDYEAYRGMEDYVKRVKIPTHIPYDVVEAALSIAYPYEPSSDATLLNRLLYEGAMVNAILEVTGGDITSLNGWDESQLRLLKDNEKNAWQTLIGYDYLYSTDRSLASKLFSPAPSTGLLSPDAPGRAGRFVGYKIVRSYIDNNPGITSAELLSPKFYNDPQTLSKAKYNPK